MRRAGEEVALALSGPADDPVRLPGGGWLFSACVPHACPVKGALLIGGDDRIRAAALFDFICSPGACPNEPRLDLFLRDLDDREAQTLLTQWADKTIARDLVAFPTAAARRLSGVEIARAAGR